MGHGVRECRGRPLRTVIGVQHREHQLLGDKVSSLDSLEEVILSHLLSGPSSLFLRIHI